jgi:hypothetical protein
MMYGMDKQSNDNCTGWINKANDNCHWKRMSSLVGTTTLVFYSGYNAPTLFRNLQERSLACRNVALSKHVTHYGPQSDFQYYDLTTPSRGPLCATRRSAEQLCGFEPWEYTPVSNHQSEKMVQLRTIQIYI